MVKKIITSWIDEVREICTEEETLEVVRYYHLIFLKLKIHVFTLLAPVNLKDESKLKKFYSHKFSIGYLYGFLLSLLQIKEFMQKKDILHPIITVAFMRTLFNFTKESSIKIYNSTNHELANDTPVLKQVN